ncbi:MAG: methionine ABC transporter ATP-binding protein, partial [Lachnospirales bacterium]
MSTIVKIENLHKTFSTKNGDIVALRDINLEINEGDIFGIIGLSGAGKSTLVRCINYLEVPTKGKVIFENKELGSLTKKELLKARQSMGMIFQNFNLLEQRNALKNVCYPLEIAGVPKKKAEERARELLNIVGLSDRIYSYPSQLSGGQKQRVAIARALATNPKVILCDEATSALDPTTTQSILELLKEINQKMRVTIIIITHEMSVIERICNKVAVIDKSRIVEMGVVKDIFANPKSDMARELITPV